LTEISFHFIMSLGEASNALINSFANSN
jgi:hypothetical protein